MLAALTWLLLTSETVLSSEPACPCSLQQDQRTVCRGWEDSCPRSPLASTSLLVITDSPSLSSLNITNIHTQASTGHGATHSKRKTGNYLLYVTKSVTHSQMSHEQFHKNKCNSKASQEKISVSPFYRGTILSQLIGSQAFFFSKNPCLVLSGFD